MAPAFHDAGGLVPRIGTGQDDDGDPGPRPPPAPGRGDRGRNEMFAQRTCRAPARSPLEELCREYAHPRIPEGGLPPIRPVQLFPA